MDTESLRTAIRDIPDHPQPGVVFKDITPLLADPETFRTTIDALAAPWELQGAGTPNPEKIDKVIGVEARGFILAAPVAHALGAGFVPVRKAGKLPWEIEAQEYELEYGTDLLEIHRDAVHPGESVLIVDDVLATGGTAAATVRLVERLGGTVIGLSFLVELEFLSGRAKLEGHTVRSLLQYE